MAYVINKRAIRHEVTCPSCNETRLVSYCQKWNIDKNKSSGRCHKCKIGVNTSGLSIGRGWNRGIYGSASHTWRVGYSNLKERLRMLIQYKNWRDYIFKRDNYSCCGCGSTGVRLEAHHIHRLSKIVKENNILSTDDAIKCSSMWDISNGKTLCVNCHNKTRGLEKCHI